MKYKKNQKEVEYLFDIIDTIINGTLENLSKLLHENQNIINTINELWHSYLLMGNNNFPDIQLFGNSPLHVACIIHDLEKIQLLLRFGAKTNITTYSDETPIMVLLKDTLEKPSITEEINIIKLLLSHMNEEDLSITNTKNQTALSLLQELDTKGLCDFQEFLKSNSQEEIEIKSLLADLNELLIHG